MTDILAKLFGSSARVKLLRLFLFNAGQAFSVADASSRARVSAREAAREISLLRGAGIVRPAGRGKIRRYALDPEFEYLEALQNLLLNAPARASDIYARLRKAGTIKLVVIAGVFMGQWDGRVDLLVVGDRVDEVKLRHSIKILESEVGKEIRYTLLPTQEFYYRLSMSDHLVRDVLDYPHRVVFDRLDIGLR